MQMLRCKMGIIAKPLSYQVMIAQRAIADKKRRACKLVKQLIGSYRQLRSDQAHAVLKAVQGTVDFTPPGIEQRTDRNGAAACIERQQFQ